MESPRSPNMLLGGMAHLGRLFDKIHMRQNRLLREACIKEFNVMKAAGETCDLCSCDLRGIDFSRSNLNGASINACKISGVLFPIELSASEIELSLLHGTRMRVFEVDPFESSPVTVSKRRLPVTALTRNGCPDPSVQHGPQHAGDHHGEHLRRDIYNERFKPKERDSVRLPNFQPVDSQCNDTRIEKDFLR